MNQNPDEIIKNLMKDGGKGAGAATIREKEDIQRRLSTIDKNSAIEKLKKMGLGPVAEKLKNTSDDELIKLISENPALLKKINSFLK